MNSLEISTADFVPILAVICSSSTGRRHPLSALWPHLPPEQTVMSSTGGPALFWPYLRRQNELCELSMHTYHPNKHSQPIESAQECQ